MEKLILEYAKRCLESGELAEMFLVIQGERTPNFEEFLKWRGPYQSVKSAVLHAQYSGWTKASEAGALAAQAMWEKEQ